MSAFDRFDKLFRCHPDEIKAQFDKQNYDLYPTAFGALSHHYIELRKRYVELLRAAQEVERRKDALEYAVEYQALDWREIYQAADVHEKNLAENGKTVRRKLSEEELH